MSERTAMTNQPTEDREGSDAGLYDLLERLELESGSDAGQELDEYHQWLEEIERRNRAEEAARMERRRPFHDRVLADLRAFDRIPLAHLMGRDEGAAERSHAYAKLLFGPGWSSEKETVGAVLNMIENVYFDLEEYQPVLMEGQDDGPLNTIPWERPYYRGPGKRYQDVSCEEYEDRFYGQGTLAGDPEAVEWAAKCKAVLAQTMPLFTGLMTTAIDVLKRYDTSLHRKPSSHDADYPDEESLDYEPPAELSAAARSDVLERFRCMGMTEDEAKLAAFVLLELPYSEISDAIWTFYDDEEIYGISNTIGEIDATGDEWVDLGTREMVRQERLDLFYNLANDCFTTIGTTGVSVSPSALPSIAGLVRDLVAQGKSAGERRALLAIETFNLLVYPCALLREFRMPR